MDMDKDIIVTLAADITAAFVSNNKVAVSDLPLVIRNAFDTLADLGSAAAPLPPEAVPAVSVRASVKPDHIACLECGKKLKTLRRHIASAHGLDEDMYRAKYSLPASYPMTAPAYSETRKAMAKAIGLGRKGRGGGRPPITKKK
jgi:predicted transcriptional regulator